jgi:hypothetical protein
VGKKAVEDRARGEYDKFVTRRRAYKNALGEADYPRRLEETAKRLSSGKKKEVHACALFPLASENQAGEKKHQLLLHRNLGCC